MAGDIPPIVRKLTETVTVLEGKDKGKYPSGNSVLVKGRGETVIIDPSITVAANGGVATKVDAVINSHGHEDHTAGNRFFPDSRVYAHHEDLLAVHSLEGMLTLQGPPDEKERQVLSDYIVDNFYYEPRPDARGFSHGTIFDLGGVSVEAVHLPGHTRGHSGFRISGGVFFLSDIDLSGFGPFYGDTWSDLDQFEASLAAVRDEEAEFYVTYHHKGVIEGREEFLRQLDAFTAVIPRRHDAMLAFLSEPRSIEDMVRHRFIYRPSVELFVVNRVEARSAELHIDRMLKRGEVEQLPDNRFIARVAKAS